MKTYRMKPVPWLELEAIQLTADNIDEVTAWCGGETFKEGNGVSLFVPTPGDIRKAQIGYFIIKNIEGDFDVCRPGWFEATYELVS